MPPKDQISITLSPQERELVQKIADELGLSVASVLRNAAIEGLEIQMEKVRKRREFLAEVRKVSK
ncbi:MAG TPA: hypothetical protein DEG17_00515 [Cyanobacteria bacterium UBA11149]|nr:hypothetical protein [Cyanobacteria bacterium UBA11367]HBE59295.1 hypothetical protein [Cyanobacteria bacterium UBA11366]HBK64836.1 hypothetical protein [Cyanobacteria bacterium UBA11166]HBR74355.1 hypothetical protein [Cyanobacteria bacterium UBA11159]HBS68795.1 hypothetical protein [Cyanobacteria bacterium UBA11153]HBW87400.1 hypothetical protein [Cyanobacteria bacterium UBA11149]HCA96101.1 hypothetical protein [Cyanobacteria bacterium UBA9226]